MDTFYRRPGKNGFTLIELMIVVAVIGILAAVAIPKFADLITKSRESSVKASLGSVRSALGVYYSEYEGIYPSNLFAALAENSSYMPTIAGLDSLGRFSIPKNSSFNGHTSGVFKSLTSASAVQNGADLSSVGTNDGINPLFYVPTEGQVYLNCTHQDSKGTIWSQY